MSNLAAYYTEGIISSLLINQLNAPSPRSILDLGIGNGSLTIAAHKRWQNAIFYATDVDKCVQQHVQDRLPFVKFTLTNGLSRLLPKKLLLEDGIVDVAICNPPYLKVSKNSAHDLLFDRAKLSECKKLFSITTDLIFLAQNLQMLKEGGEMGIIVPDGLITSHNFIFFRDSLLTNHNLKGVITLPERIFRKTEAKTHILIIEKGKPSHEQIPVMQSDVQGRLVSKLMVKSSELVKRMDYDHFGWRTNTSNLDHTLTLGNTVETINRGNLSYKQLRESSFNYLHTTNVNHQEQIEGKQEADLVSNCIIAEKGDIILARVGRNCIGRTALVKKGSFVISDCLYRIRPKPGYEKKVWNALCSETGQAWLKGYSHGVCAKVISKKDLVNFPI